MSNCGTALADPTDTLTATQSAASLPRGNPETLTFATSASAIDGSGDGPYLYAVVQPAGSGPCQSTYGTDLEVVGSQAVSLISTTNTEVKTGTDSHSYNYTTYTPGTYTQCSWLEIDPKDSSTADDTSADVTASATTSFTVANTDAVGVSFSSATPEVAAPLTITVGTQASPIDSSGDGPYLYSVLQPSSAGACQTTYGTDLRVVGSQAVGLAPTANQEVKTGQDIHAYNYTSYTPGSYTVCSWLETDAKDSSTANDTPAVVTAKNSTALTIANPDTVSTALSASNLIAGQTFTVTASGSAAPINSTGATPYLYALIQPTSVGSCGSTYGLDLEVARTQAAVLAKGVAVTTPTYSEDYPAKLAAGSYEQCSWLESDEYDSQTENDTSAVVLSSSGPTTLTVASAPVIPAPKLSAIGLSGLTTGAARVTFSAIAEAGTLTSVKVTLPVGITPKSNALLNRDVAVTSGGKSVRATVTHAGQTITITLKAAAKSVNVTLGATALTESASLKKSAKAHPSTKLKLAFTLTNTSGGVTTSTASLRP